MHFSIALAGFIKSQVLHFHPSFPEGGFNPAAPQLNPPPVALSVAVVEGTVPNPVKLGLNADPAGLGVPNEKPDEVVDGVELDAPNRSGPEGGAGMERVIPEPEPEEVVPGFGASQTVHFSLADAGFIRSQVPHFHPSMFVVGSFNPAAPQLNPPEPEPAKVVVVEVPPEPHTKGVEGGFGGEVDGVAEGFSAPGFDASQTVHFSAADVGFIKSQVPHFHPPVFDVGGFNPAAPQSNPPEPEVVEVEVAAIVVVGLVPKENGVEGGLGMENEGEATGLAAPGLGVSHTVHFSAAEAGFIKSQVPHFHPLSCFGGFKPAAPQLNPPFVAEGVVVVVVEAGGANVGVDVGSVAMVVLELAL